MMRIAVAVLLLLTAPAAAAPARIMSLKVCTDALLMDLVPAPRIASVTYLSREPATLRYWPQAARLPVNHGTVEEVLAIHPDLILTDTFTPPDLKTMLAKSGATLVEVPPAEDFAGIRAAIRQVAAAVGEIPRGETLIAGMDKTLAGIAAHRPGRRIRIAGWGAGGYVPGRGSLFDAALREAGADNIETGPIGYFDVEALLAARPDVLAYGDAYRGTPTRRADQDLHPALMARYRGRRILYPSALLSCGVPESAAATLGLQQAMLRAVKP